MGREASERREGGGETERRASAGKAVVKLSAEVARSVFREERAERKARKRGKRSVCHRLEEKLAVRVVGDLQERNSLNLRVESAVCRGSN